MVIIRVKSNLRPEQAKIITEDIHMQARAGVIVLPASCELLNEVPADEEIQVVHQDTRVAELEKELQQQAAMCRKLRERLCRHCTYADDLTFAPACLVCDDCDLFRPKGGGV